MRYGDQIAFPTGYATNIGGMDFETYSEAGYIWDKEKAKWSPPRGMKKTGLSVVGMRVYAEHPTTEVLVLHYDLQDGRGDQVWHPDLIPPFDLFEYVQSGRLISAFNAGFEYAIWKYCCMRRYSWPEPRVEWFSCSSAKSRVNGYPGKLSEVGSVLNLAVQKDKEGAALIKRFCMPRQPSKKDPRKRILLSEDEAGAAKLSSYCETDVAAEQGVNLAMPDMAESLRQAWLFDQRVNERGIHIDHEGVENAISILEQAQAKYNPLITELSGGAITATSEVQSIREFIALYGIQTDSLDEETLDALLEREDIPEVPRRILEIRSLMASAAVKKLYSIRARIASDGRLHDLFIFHGARTGRYTGEGPQPHNLTKAGPPLLQCEACSKFYNAALKVCPHCGADSSMAHQMKDWTLEQAEYVLWIMSFKRLDYVEYYVGPPMLAISGCIRALFTAAPGKELICSDYHSIEAVVLAALAGEEWRLEVFRTHGLIYETSAAKIMGVPLQEFIDYKRMHGVHHPMRQKLGKISELASGYRGWINAWKQFGADEFFQDEEIKQHILAWRGESPMIVEFWGGQSRGWGKNRREELFGIEGAFISAFLHPGQAFGYRGIYFQRAGNAVHMRLLSGRIITYHNVTLEPGDRERYSIWYETYNTNPKYGPIGWIKLPTHGGKITENIVQAAAFDILLYAQLRLEEKGYPTVMHVHDENIAEIDIGYGSVEEYEAVMSDLPPWAKGWPLHAAGGWRGALYRKG